MNDAQLWAKLSVTIKKPVVQQKKVEIVHYNYIYAKLLNRQYQSILLEIWAGLPMAKLMAKE